MKNPAPHAHDRTWVELATGREAADACHPLGPPRSRLEVAGSVDGQHLVRVFRVDYAGTLSSASPAVSPRRLVKYVDRAHYAPCVASALRLATLAHYRTRYPDLEGVGDDMEGRASIQENLAEFCERAGRSYPSGAHYVQVGATHQGGDSSLIWCTAASTGRPERHWTVACRISDSSAVARQLGIECARQHNRLWRSDSSVPKPRGWRLMHDLPQQLPDGCEVSVSYGPEAYWVPLFVPPPPGRDGSVVDVFHGPVMYSDAPVPWLDSLSPLDRPLAIQFCKRVRFAHQEEYRFVVSCFGHKPTDGSVFVDNTDEIRELFEPCAP